MTQWSSSISLAFVICVQSASAADLPRVCKINGAAKIEDKLETYVQSGVGFITNCEANDCCIQSKYREILLIARDQNASIWARAVYFDRLNIGLPGKNLSVSLVDSEGRDTGVASGEYEIKNQNATTDKNGLALLPIIVRFTKMAPASKIYRIRFSYADRGAISFSYGPYFYIRDANSKNASKELSLRGFRPFELK